MKTRGHQEGAAAIELAIILPIFILLLFGITEFGRAIYQYNSLVKSTRDAARFLSMQAPGKGEAIARCLAVYGNRDCQNAPLVAGLDESMVSISYQSAVSTCAPGSTSACGGINLVSVSIQNFSFTSLAPAYVPSMTFGPVSTLMRQGGS